MPNVLTLNAVLQVISGFNSPQAKVKAKSMIAEFSSLGIQPSLATYYLLLTIFSRESKLFKEITQKVLLISKFLNRGTIQPYPSRNSIQIRTGNSSIAGIVPKWIII